MRNVSTILTLLFFLLPFSTGCAQVILPYADAPIILDGDSDSAYSATPLAIEAAPASSSIQSESDLSATWTGAYDADYLYLLVEVTDDLWITNQPDSWNNDGIELFLDGNDSDGSPVDDNDLKFLFVTKSDGSVSVITNGFPPNPAGLDYSGVMAAMTFTGSEVSYQGYRMEIIIPMHLLGVESPGGNTFGIDFQVDDNDTEGSRDDFLTWVGSSLNNHPESYGSATLAAAPSVIPVTGVEVSPSEVRLIPGEEYQLTGTVRPSNADNNGLLWMSDNPEVATVDANGKLTGEGTGMTQVTVTTAEGGYSVSIPVIVNVSVPFSQVIGANVESSPDRFQSDWFGSFTEKQEDIGWIVHDGLGSLYTNHVDTEDKMQIWSEDLDAWIYTSRQLFPYYWIYDEGWNYHYTSPAGSGYRYDFSRNHWYQTAPIQHPYLYFSAKDIPALRARMDDPAFAARRTRLMTAANTLLTSQPSSSSRPNQGNCIILAFAYVVTGDERFAERAIIEALTAVDLDMWIEPRAWNRGADLISSEFSLGTSIVYDWCYAVMSDAERHSIREGIIEKGIEPYLLSVDPELNENWWNTHPVNNWRGVCHGGNSVAALALYFESSRARAAAHSGYFHVKEALLAHILEDSGGHEGVGYNGYGTEYSLIGATALQRFFGGYEEALREVADSRLGAYWSSYLHAPDRVIVNFGRHPDWGSGLWSQTGDMEGGPLSLHSALFDALVPGGDSLLRWGADNGGQRFYWNAGSPFYFIWRRSAPSTYQDPKPELQDAVLFRGAGHAVFQSPELFFAYSGGAVHNRGDLGAFVLVAGDERLIHVQPNLSNLDSEFQSTYIINGTQQSTGGPPPRGEYLAFGSGEHFHYLASRISPVYEEPLLLRAVRHVIMVRDRYIVLLDDLMATDPIDWEARFQSAYSFSLGADRASVNGNANLLHILNPGTEGITRTLGSGGELNYLSLRFNSREMVVPTVLYPVPLSGTNPVANFDGTTLTVTMEGETDQIVFTEGADGWMLESVNGESALDFPDGSERTVVPIRENGNDAEEVPSWLLETVR